MARGTNRYYCLYQVVSESYGVWSSRTAAFSYEAPKPFDAFVFVDFLLSGIYGSNRSNYVSGYEGGPISRNVYSALCGSVPCYYFHVDLKEWCLDE